jgi:hypothetical protein
MPTIQDIANQINNTLTQINQNTQDTANTAALIKGDTADLKTKLDALTAATQAGFADLSLGLFALLESHKKANSLSEVQVAQNQTIICNLENANDLLCRISRKMTDQIALQEEIRDHTKRLRLVSELVHAREAADVTRLEALEQRIDECCPPEQPRPEPCPDPCERLEVSVYEPTGQDWRPRDQEKPR